MADEDDFIQQMIPHQGSLYRFVLSLVGNCRDAEDLHQQTMLTLWQKWGDRDREGKILAWAFAIAKNHVRNHVRKKSRRGEVTGLNADAVDRIAERQIQLASNVDSRKCALDDCLNQLPVEQRQLVEAYYDREQPVERLAERFHKSVDAFYKSLQRIRKSLFECISSQLSLGQSS